MTDKDPKTTLAKPAVSRRKFLTGAAAATTGAAIIGKPVISSPVVAAAAPVRNLRRDTAG